MPKDNIERAIAKGTGADQDADAFEAIVYEGYGPAGVAMLVEALTDNRNRTGADVRHLFTKHNGNLGEPGSVDWIFEKKGEIFVDAARYSEDDLMAAIDAGAEDVTLDGDVFEIVTGADRSGRGARGARGRRASRSSRPSWSSARRRRVEVEEHDARRPDAADRRARGERRRPGRARELRHRRRRARARRGLAQPDSPVHGRSRGSQPGTRRDRPRSLAAYSRARVGSS